MADDLFFFILMSVLFAQIAGLSEKRWVRIYGYSGAIIFNVLAIVAIFAGRTLS